MSTLQTNSPDPIPDKFNDLRNLLIDSYNLASDIPDMINVNKENPLQLITSCLFIKVLNTTRAILLLIENNLLSEVYVLLRHQMEAIFVLSACQKDESFLKTYIASDQKYRLRLGNVILNNKNDSFSLEELEEIKELKPYLKTIVDEQGIKEINVEELSKKAGLEAIYNSAYRLFSNIVHVGVKSLDNYLLLDEKENIEELKIYPYQEDIAILYLTAINLILIAIECLNSIFKVKLDEKVYPLKDQLHVQFETHSES